MKFLFNRFTQLSVYPWIVIALSASFLFYKYILQVSPNVMSTELMQAFQLDGAGLGYLAACFFFAYFVTQLFVGVALDRFSLRHLAGFALLVSAVGTLLFAKTNVLGQAAVYRGMMGFGAAFATVSYLKAASVWFKPERFAFVSGLLASAAMLGAVFGEAPLAYCVNHFGWREAMWFGLLAKPQSSP